MYFVLDTLNMCYVLDTLMILVFLIHQLEISFQIFQCLCLHTNSQYLIEWGKMKAFPLRLWGSTSIPICTTLPLQNAGGVRDEIRKEKETKDVTIGKEEMKISVPVNDMVLYMKNPKVSPKKAIKNNEQTQ